MSQVDQSSDYNEDTDPVKTYERATRADTDFYDTIIATKGERNLVYEDILEPHTGNSFLVRAGQTIRFEQRPGLHNGRTQIIDVMFVTPDLDLYGDHLNTSAFDGLNQRLYSGVWTQSNKLRKIATCVADEFPYEKLDEGVTHMFFAAHCNADWLTMLYGEDGNVNSCHENFLHAFNRLPAIQAIEDEQERREIVQRMSDRNDINIFQGNRFGQDNNAITRCNLYPSPAVEDGTGVEYYAERDLYAVVSNCPYADQANPFPECRPNPVYIIVEDTGIAPKYADPLKIPDWEEKLYERIFTKDVSAK